MVTNASTAMSNGVVSGRLFRPAIERRLPLLVCIHGGGSNGRYFELKGRSLAASAVARGFPTLLLNRPGHGGNPPLADKAPIAASVPLIRHFVDEVRGDAGLAGFGVALIGHSIGGAVALRLAAARGDWPLVGLAVSGIGDVSPPAITAMPPGGGGGGEAFAPSPAFSEALFHDPDRLLNWKALASLRAATEPWLAGEVAEIVFCWPSEWPTVAARINAPVHLRLAEHERIWGTGEVAVARMAAALGSSSRVDAALLRGGGHLYEAYRDGPALIAAQLDFLADCAATATASTAAPIRSCSASDRSG